ncbi:MAG: hypothetical protein AAF800_10015 [Planctomycetota bacterium]
MIRFDSLPIPVIGLVLLGAVTYLGGCFLPAIHRESNVISEIESANYDISLNVRDMQSAPHVGGKLSMQLYASDERPFHPGPSGSKKLFVYRISHPYAIVFLVDARIVKPHDKTRPIVIPAVHASADRHDAFLVNLRLLSERDSDNFGLIPSREYLLASLRKFISFHCLVNDDRSIFLLTGEINTEVFSGGKVVIEYTGRFTGDLNSSVQVKFVGYKKYLGYVLLPNTMHGF